MSLTVLYKDITTVEADAIVNSSNPLLYGFSGGDALLHKLGGPEFEKECAEKAGTLLPGEAVFTNAYNIPAKYVIHTHIPAYDGGVDGEAAILRSCYRSSLELAEQLGCKSVAFPLIAAGSMGFPIPKALEIAVVSISEYLQLYGDLIVFLVIRGGAATEIAQSMMGDLDEYVQKHFGTGLGEKEQKTLEELIADKGESFVDILYRYMDEKGIDKPSQLYKAAHVSKQAFSKLVSGSVAKPSKETAVGLAFALQLTYEEAVPFFRAAGIALSNANKYDIIVEYFLKHHNYDIWEFNEQVLKYGHDKLIGADE
ncbi:MAG: macro domain-containing protein [Firmicutes bacterium]|nr:macro domain-containing protein [Bacillota bacterium]